MPLDGSCARDDKFARRVSLQKLFVGFSALTVVFVLSTFLLSDRLPDEDAKTLSYINEFDEDDLGCGSFPFDERIQTQQRILASLRKEILASVQRLDTINSQYDAINNQMSAKKQELDEIEQEVELARRVLKEWSDKRNVRVSLPRSPVQLPAWTGLGQSVDAVTFEKAIDFSRCPIANFLRVYVHPPSSALKLADAYYQSIRSSQWHTENEAQACLTVSIVDSANDVNISRNSLVLSLRTNTVLVGSRTLEMPLLFAVPEKFEWSTFPPLLPLSRDYFFTLFASNSSRLQDELVLLQASADKSMDKVAIFDCSKDDCTMPAQKTYVKSALFTIVYPDAKLYEALHLALSQASIPVILSMDTPLPFDHCVDWTLAVIRLPRARSSELHFILRSYPLAEILELRRMGRLFFEHYVGSLESVSKTLLACISRSLGLPSLPQRPAKSTPLFNSSYVAKYLTPVNKPALDDEFIGPQEAAVDSPSFNHNFTSIHMYSHKIWSSFFDAFNAPEYLPFSVDPPTLSQFYNDSNIGFRPISPGAGREFNEALGGNRPREQFTIVIISYNRDAVLEETLIKLHRLPFLNKIIVVWNSVGRDPPTSWPRLHVPVEFISVAQNSLNNRFIPWDRITTEAVLSLDDDIDIRQPEIILGFRIWRENRDVIVGYPARFHARFSDAIYYNSNKTCQLSMILTGYAFIHKAYFYLYTNSMPPAIREHVDKVMNCEDIAMNFLVSHVTRKPPIKATSKWTLRCPTCADKLSNDESHFNERHECIRLFSHIYGYNPLKFSQFRADSVLFKTRVDANSQKCYRFV